MKKYSLMYGIMGSEIHYEIQGKSKSGKTWSIYWFNQIDSTYTRKTIIVWSTKNIPISEMDAIGNLGSIVESERAYFFHPIFCFFVCTRQKYQVSHVPLCVLDNIITQPTTIDRICWIYSQADNLEIGFKINKLSLCCFEQVRDICFAIEENYLGKLLEIYG